MAAAVFLGTVINDVVSPHIPDSPCPEVFQYKSHNITGDTSITVTGLITITTPPIETLLYLVIHMQLQAILPSKYVGLIELVKKSNTTIGNQNVYRVLFPLANPIPSVRFIAVNYYVICNGPPVAGAVVTDIHLEHTLQPLPRMSYTTMPAAMPEHQITHNIELNGECGRSVLANPLVVGGRLVERGEWPWLAAIFILNSYGLEYHCSGSLITRTFVITVGHCMHHHEAGVLMPSDVVVYLGKFNLHLWEEPYSVIKEVNKIHIHPDFNPTKFSADIVLLQLKKPAEYNFFIQPVCLWSQSAELDFIVGRFGTVVGWGKGDRNSNKLSPTPRVLEIPIVSTEECVDSHSEFVFLTSSTTLCAGARDGVGPCNGDSGGGLMLPVTVRNVTRWHLRGLISLSLLNSTTQSCDLSQYIVFTDTAKFLSWIASIISILQEEMDGKGQASINHFLFKVKPVELSGITS